MDCDEYIEETEIMEKETDKKEEGEEESRLTHLSALPDESAENISVNCKASISSLLEEPNPNNNLSVEEPVEKSPQDKSNYTKNTLQLVNEIDSLHNVATDSFNNNISDLKEDHTTITSISGSAFKTCDVACQTSIDMLESNTYRKFSLDLKELQIYQGYVSVDSLEFADSNFEGWAEMIVMQLKARDSIIDILHTYLIDLLRHGKSLEMDLEYLKFKVEELTEQTKLLKQKLKMKKKKLNKMTQTEVDYNAVDEGSNWYGSSYYNYYDYYDENYYHNNIGNTDMKLKPSYFKEQPYNEFGDQQTQPVYGNQQSCDVFEDQQSQGVDEKKEPSHGIGGQHLSTLLKMDLPTSTSPEEVKVQSEQLAPKEEVLPSSTNERDFSSSHFAVTDPKNKTDEIFKHACKNKSVYKDETSDILSEKTKKELELPPNNINKSYKNETNTQWNSNDIIKEVKDVAEKVVQQSGYAFIEETGVYYDHNSGYYYDPKTSLYYDGKTGTYFYFDHASNSYQFYSQVNLGQEDENITQMEHAKKRKIIDQNFLDKEEGECSESSDDNDCNDVEGDLTQCTKSALPDNIKPSDIAPSLRLMVMDGAEKGNLHIVTLDGGTIGRENHNLVVLKNASVSKVHAKVAYKSEGIGDHHYYIKDIGSNNGTYIKGRRLSESRVTSEETELGHGWEVKCGEVTLACHIHPGLLTCNTCEPGLLEEIPGKIRNGRKGSTSGENKKERERRRQNKAIRKKFSINWHDDPLASSNAAYKDRAHERRDAVGSDNPYEKTDVASVETNLPSSNKGFQLLQKIGWSEGHGLGLNEDGRTNAVIPKTVVGRSGLGSATSFSSVPSAEKTPFQKRMDIALERYNAMSDDTVKETTATAAATSFQPINFVSKLKK